MTDLVNTPAEPPVDTTNSLLGTPPAEPNPTDPPAEPVTPPAGAPETIDGYEVNVEGFNYDDFKAIPENQEFLERAREAGLEQRDHKNQGAISTLKWGLGIVLGVAISGGTWTINSINQLKQDMAVIQSHREDHK